MPIVNEYDCLEIPGASFPFRVLYFPDDATWLEFVCACRRGEEIYLDYDVIVGPVADDSVYEAVDGILSFVGSYGVSSDD